MSENSRHIIFCTNVGACGSREEFTKTNACHKPQECHFEQREKRLWQLGRPLRAYCMSKINAIAGPAKYECGSWDDLTQTNAFQKIQGKSSSAKKKACDSREDLAKPNTCQKIRGMSLVCPRESPAAEKGRPVHVIHASFFSLVSLPVGSQVSRVTGGRKGEDGGG